MSRAILIASLALAQAWIAAPAAAQSAQAMAQNCFVCHGPGARGSLAVVALAGRPEELIAQQMLAFRSDLRTGTIMNRIAKGYDEAQIAAIAAHLAKLPR
jgi:sulfide dehydrogenase cytochrome subunit